MHKPITYDSDSGDIFDDLIEQTTPLSPDEKFNITKQNINDDITIHKTGTKHYNKTKYNDLIHFKLMCNSLNPNINVHNKIKRQIIMNYTVYPHKIYTGLLQNIYEKGLTDFTINFISGQSFKCMKMIIQIIPYFDMMFNECDIQDTVTITDDYECVMIIMRLLHYNVDNLAKLVCYDNIIGLGIENCIDVLLIADKYLMANNMDILILFIKNNINDIIEYFINNNNNDKILLLEQLMCIMIANDNYYHDICQIKTTIYQTNFGEFIFKFNNWNKKFYDFVIFNVIKESKKYDLLNILHTSPLKNVMLLDEIDFSSNIYYELYKHQYQNHSYLSSDTLPPKNDNSIIISSYYPILKYTCYDMIKCRISKFENYYVDICLNEHFICNISVGTKIIIGDVTNTEYHTITKIIKYSEDQKIEIPHLYHISYPKQINYELHFDKQIHHSSKLWKLTTYEYKINT